MIEGTSAETQQFRFFKQIHRIYVFYVNSNTHT